jgi:hypothetical protein
LEESAMRYCRTHKRSSSMYQLEKEHTENESRAFSKSCSSYDFKAAAQVSSSTFKEVTVVIVIPSV